MAVGFSAWDAIDLCNEPIQEGCQYGQEALDALLDGRVRPRATHDCRRDVSASSQCAEPVGTEGCSGPDLDKDPQPGAHQLRI